VTLSTHAPARRAQNVGLWVAQIGLALLFAGAGASKLAGSPAMVDMFSDVGAGQWLRYVVGALEVAGAVGLLVPRLTVAAACGLAALMVGATLANVFLLDASPLLPIALAVVAGAIAWARHHHAPSTRP